MQLRIALKIKFATFASIVAAVLGELFGIKTKIYCTQPLSAFPLALSYRRTHQSILIRKFFLKSLKEEN
jgi:hypothetical protein